MVDYYSLAAILAPLKRPNKGRTDRDLPLGTPAEIAALNERDDTSLVWIEQIKELAKTKPADGEQRMAARARSEQQLRRRDADLPRAYRCLKTARSAPVTHLLLSGRAANPGPSMQPRVPAVLAAAQPIFPPAGRPQHAAAADAGQLDRQ